MRKAGVSHPDLVTTAIAAMIGKRFEQTVLLMQKVV
jgi:hypothetical protein